MSQVSIAEIADIIGMARDVVFFLLLLAGLFAVIFLYRKVSRLLDLARRTAESVENLATTVSDKVVEPATAGSGVAFGFGKVVAFLFGLLTRGRRKKGG